jgi:poly(3-hydroxybutyrate) depolymerase
MVFPLSSSLLLALSLSSLAVAQLQVEPGCSKPIPSNVVLGTSQSVSIESGGLERSYLLNVPTSYDGKSSAPLILSFHGRGKSAEEQKELSQFANATVNPNAISVYPQGLLVIFLIFSALYVFQD